MTRLTAPLPPSLNGARRAATAASPARAAARRRQRDSDDGALPGRRGARRGGTLGWSLGAEGRGYSTLLGTTADGEGLLATRSSGRFDVVSRHGEVLWSYDPQDAALAHRIPRVDLRQLQPFLQADGSVLLTDRRGRAIS